MIWGQFNDPVSHNCLAGIVVTSWYLTQQVTSSNPITLITNIERKLKCQRDLSKIT